jgi:hypothetical protein
MPINGVAWSRPPNELGRPAGVINRVFGPFAANIGLSFHGRKLIQVISFLLLAIRGKNLDSGLISQIFLNFHPFIVDFVECLG